MIKSKSDKFFDIIFNKMLDAYYLGDISYLNYLNIAKKINSNNKELRDFEEIIKKVNEVVYDNLLEDCNWNKKLEIVLLITLKCNQKCLFCNVNKWNTIIPLKIIEKFLKDKILKYKLIEKKNIKIHISWWEPTMHPDFINVLDVILKYSDDVEIQTNWIFFWLESNINNLNKYKWLHFYISFHSHIEETYNKITETKWQYELAIKGIKNILNLWNKWNVVLNTVINKYNINLLIDYLLFTRNNFNNIPLNITILRIEDNI